MRAAQGRFDESEKLHQRALIIFQMTIGNKYHRTADVSHKLAQHCMRRAKSRDAAAIDTALSAYTLLIRLGYNTNVPCSKLVDQALSIWAANEAAYKPELTRTTFLKSKVLASKESSDKASLALAQTVSGYRSLVPGSKKEGNDLTEADVDELVTFWSR